MGHSAFLERYPHLWQKFTDLSNKTPKNSRIMHRVKIKQYPNDFGITTAYDADTETYTVIPQESAEPSVQSLVDRPRRKAEGRTTGVRQAECTNVSN